jgi:hypothetical protein
MNTLRILTAGMLFAAATVAGASTADEQIIDTITVTAKRHTSGPTADRIAPESNVAITVIMPTDMPEAEIDYHVSPISVPHADRRASDILTP